MTPASPAARAVFTSVRLSPTMMVAAGSASRSANDAVDAGRVRLLRQTGAAAQDAAKGFGEPERLQQVAADGVGLVGAKAAERRLPRANRRKVSAAPG